jgi:predicted esterase
VNGGDGADTIRFLSFASSSQIVGGVGNDTISFVDSFTSASSGNTYFFGTNGGQDTIDFTARFASSTSVVAGNALTLAYSSDTGTVATQVTIDSTTFASTSQTKIQIGSAGAVWVVGYSQGAITTATGSPILITTVSNSTITALG